MKTISMWSALGLALALGSAVGCGSTGGCGTTNANMMQAAPITTCGYGTVANNGECVMQAAPAGGGGGGCAAGYTSSNGTCVPAH